MVFGSFANGVLAHSGSKGTLNFDAVGSESLGFLSNCSNIEGAAELDVEEMLNEKVELASILVGNLN